jgi:prephenate dehydrogenase
MDLDPATVQRALESGAADAAAYAQEGIPPADLTLLALYPEAAVDFLRQHARNLVPGSLVVDLCGVKRYVCEQADRLLSGTGVAFLGGHPMAGKAAFGFDSASADLFEGASMILTPAPDFPPRLLDLAQAFFRSLGFGGVTLTTPERHDEMIALTSQLAHVVSSAYVQNPNAERHAGFSAGSFKDMTRVARLNEDMWTELFLRNADMLAEQTDMLIGSLTRFRDSIRAGDRDGLRALLKNGREVKERLLAAERKGPVDG